MGSGQRVRAVSLIVAVLSAGVALAAWKQASIDETNAAAANQPEPVESVIGAGRGARTPAHDHLHRHGGRTALDHGTQ